MNDEEKQPRFIAMIGLVALIVAVVILVFFGIGYLFGEAARQVMGNVKHIEHEIFGVLLLGGIAFFTIRWLMKRRKPRRAS